MATSLEDEWASLSAAQKMVLLLASEESFLYEACQPWVNLPTATGEEASHGDGLPLTEAKDVVAGLRVKGLISLFWPQRSDDAELDEDEAARVLANHGSWTSPAERPAPALCLTPAGEKLWHGQ